MVALDAGNLHLSGSSSGSLTEQLGQLIFQSGANTLHLTHHAGAGDFTALGVEIFQLEGNATLNLKSDQVFGSAGDLGSVRFFLGSLFPFQFPIGEVLWMGTVNGEDWVTTAKGSDNNTYFVAFEDYHTGGDSDFWQPDHHVLIDGQAVPVYSYITEISTLKLTNGADLELFGTLDFKGLLSTGVFDNQIGAWGGELRFEYAHVYSPTLSLVDGARIWTSNLVKTGPGTLRLNASPWTPHRTTDLRIHQGKVALESGELQARNIIVSDGTGTDSLELPANRINPIQGLGSSEQPNPRRNIKLHGTPYGDPDSGEFDAAILRFGGSTEQRFDDFRVEGRGTIDFVGGTQADPNRLFIEDFFLGDAWTGDFSTTTVFVRNWEDKEDLFLVRYKQSNIARIDSAFLARIKFEGYDTPAEWVYYNNDYWEIRPMAEPEPATTGAILGVVGLGLVVWRKKRKQ